MNLSKISLKKSGESHKIDLTKNRRRIHVNLNWDQRRGLFSRGIDLDLACMYRLKDGRQGVIQALGNSFGAADQPPLHQAGQGRPLRRQRQRRKHGLLPAGADRLRRGFRLHL